MENTKDRAKKILQKMESQSADKENLAKERAKRIFDSGALDYDSRSADLKKQLAGELGSGKFDANASKGLVKEYAAVQFKIFDDNLKNGITTIKPVGDNLSNLFKAHGYDFNELYPDLADMYSSGNDMNGGFGNLEAYAYNNSDKFRAEWDEKHDPLRDAKFEVAIAEMKKNAHQEKADAIAEEYKGKAGDYNAELERLNSEVDWNSLSPDERLSVSNANKIKAMQNTGYYKNPVGFDVSPEENRERKAAAEAAKEETYAREAYNSLSKGLEVRSKADFEEKSSYIIGNDGKPMSTDEAYDEEMWGISKDDYLTYAYILNTEGDKAANEFYSSIENTVNAAEAEKISAYHQKLEKGDFTDKASSALGQTSRAFASGIEGLAQGFKGIGDAITGDTEYYMPGVNQMVTAKNKESASTAGKLFLGASEGLPQVLGTAALGAVNPVLGTAFLGSTAFGTSYVDAINSGATRGQAVGLGLATAGLEIALEYAVGNTISGFGTSLSSKVGKRVFNTSAGKKLISGLDRLSKTHPKAAVAIKTFGNLLGNSSSEFVEEYLAETASPLLRNAFLNENNKFTIYSDAQLEAGLIGFITGGILDSARSTAAIADIMNGGYRLKRQNILQMSDTYVISEYIGSISDAEIAAMLSAEDPSFNNLDGRGMMEAIDKRRSELASEISAEEARKELIERERFIASVSSVSEYAKQGLSYDEAIEKTKMLGVDISGFEVFTRSAYDIGKSQADKADIQAEVQKLINAGESTKYISKVTGMSTEDISNAKAQLFSQSLENTSMSDSDKVTAIRRYTLKEQALDRMYELGALGLEFDPSMSAGVISEADAYKAFTRGENAAKAQKAAAEKVKAAADAKIFDEAPTAPSATEDIQSEESTSDVSADVDTIIGGMGSMGRTLYNKILNPAAGEVEKTSELKAAIAGFAHVYEAGTKGVNYKRSKAGPLQIKEINAIYEAAKKDAAARAKVNKKTDAKVIKDEAFKTANVSKRSERILKGVAKIVGRDIRFSDNLEGNAKIDLEKGEIVISTRAKTGHTWAMIHEVYHALVIDSPAEAAILKKTVLDIAKKNPEAYKRFRKKYEIAYNSELFDENNKMRIDASEYISEEMVADLVGFTLSEPSILKKLTGQQRNILQKFVDKLVSMFGNADAELKEEYLDRFGGDIRAIFKDVAREADSIAEQFKAALDTSQKAEKNTVERDGVRSSKDLFGEVNEDAINEIRSIGRKNINDLTSDEIKTAEPFARLMWKTLKEKSPFFRAWFGDWRANDTKTTVRHVTVQSDTRGLHRNIDTGWDINHSAKVHTESHNSKASISGKAFLPYIDGIIENAVLLNSEISDNENENSIMFHSLYSVVNDGDNKAIIKLIVEEMKNPGKSIERRAYKLVDIEKLPTSALGSQNANLFAEVDSINNISQLIGIVKAFDKSYNPKPSSVVVDENGIPKKVYHSTSEKFDAFDITKSRSWDGVPDYDLPGFYFAENYDTSAAYGDIVGEYYIKITKPYEGGLYDLKREHGTYRAAYDYLVSQGYDGVIVDEFGEGDYEYIVLKDVNIKSATDNIGTYDSSNANTKMSKELFPDDRTMSAEEIERDEIEQYIQQIKSSDDLSDADVQAIREEITQSRKQQREQLLAEIATTNLARWGADLGRQEESGKVLSINEAIKKVEESFGVKVTSGGDASVAGSNVSSYNESTRTIRTKFKNDLPAVCHALGYHIDKALGVVDKAIEQTAEIRRQNGDGEGILEQELKRMVKLDGKDSRKAIKEGFAEFIRMYLVSKNLAQEAAPIFYSEFESMLKEDAELQKAVETSAEAVHGYFVQSAGDRGGAAVMTAEDWKQFNKPRGKEAIRTARDWVTVRLFDRFYGIKSAEKEQNVFDLSTSKSAYVKATLSLTARSKAARLLDNGFYDANGNKVGEGFFDIIEELGAEYTDKFKAFGDYLSFVHALEWIEPNKVAGKKTSSGKDIYNAKAKGKVFADETLNDATELKRIIADMESKHPDFKGIAERIYKYQDNLMNYYLVPSGALSRDQAETFKAQYPHYVPFNRFNTVFGEATKSGKGGNNYFGNLKNPIQKADGGNAPIRHPLESIINSTFSAVDFYMKNDTMKAMIEEFTGNGALPGVMERIYSTEELKKLDEKGNNPFDVEEGKTLDESKETAFSPVIDKEKGIVYAWVNGEKRFYQIYDRGLYNAVANLEVQNLRGFFRMFNAITNVLKVTMTMRNPLFGPGNFYRDFMTFHYNTTSNANILMQLGMYAGALKNIAADNPDSVIYRWFLKPFGYKIKNESYMLYKALGGGDMGKFTADVDAVKRTVARRNSKAIKWSEMSARDFGQKVIKNVGGLKFLWDKFFELNDIFETLPRLAEFKYTMESTHGDEQLAMYRSQDVTTNFSRSGSWGRNLNAIFLFSNAELQGIDKMVRNYTEAAYTEKGKNGEPNKAIIAGKILKTVGWSLFMTALSQFINRRDDEAEEEYARLSEFIKNNYDVFYVGNGYFAKVPKEQNLAIPRTVMQRIFDAVKGDDVDFRELGSYIWDGITPGFVPDVFDLKNVPHQIANNTPISVFTDVMANRDFKGAEIVPSYLDGPEYLKYNNYTSALSVGLAKRLYEKTGFDISPMALDHYIGAFGYYGTLFTDLMPYVDVNEKGVAGAIKDNWFNALGVKNKFSVDARYSTDLLNDFYKGRDRADARLGIEANGENRLVNERYKVLGSLISGYNKQSRTGSEEQQRLDRKMLQVILEGFDEGNFSEGEEYVMKLYEATGNEAVFVSSFPGPELRETETKKGKKIITTAVLDANVYAEYCNEISRMREAVRVLIRDLGLDETEAAEFLAKEYSNINADVKAKYLSLYGKTEETVAEKKETKFDRKAYEKAYEDALNNEIYGD